MEFTFTVSDEGVLTWPSYGRDGPPALTERKPPSSRRPSMRKRHEQ
jgi:hypothetical protein